MHSLGTPLPETKEIYPFFLLPFSLAVNSTSFSSLLLGFLSLVLSDLFVLYSFIPYSGLRNQITVPAIQMPLNTPSVVPVRPVSPAQFANYEQTRKAIDAIQNKGPIADIDFTIHVMEDGSEVCTTERIVKGKDLLPRII
jgi:hypothetical protein